MRTGAQDIWKHWQRFWFESNHPRQMRLFRMGFALWALTFYLVRSIDLNLYFSETGMMPLSLVSEIAPMQYKYSLLSLSTSPVFLWACNLTFLGALAALGFGVFSRTAAVIAFLLHVSILHRNMTLTFGADLIATFFLLYLCFARYERDDRCPVSSISFRMLQIQLCIIYGYSGLDKARGPQWWGGEAMWGVLANSQLTRFDFTFMAHFPILIVAMTYATLIFEIYFPVLVWVKPVRKFLLVYGILMHIGIAIMVSIPYFGVLMMLPYVLFLEGPALQRIENGLNRYLRIPVWNA